MVNDTQSWWDTLNLNPTILIAALVGFVLLVALYLMKSAGARRRAAATPDYSEAIGQIATVSYLVSPVQRPGGQVVVTIQGKLVTLDALQKGSQPITAGTQVKVIGKKDASTLIVESID